MSEAKAPAEAWFLDVQTGAQFEEKCGFLYALLAARPKNMNISHRGMPSYPQHEGFVRSKPYAHWLIVCSRSQLDFAAYVGTVYLTHAREIGIHIAAQHKGKGYGWAAMNHIMNLAGRGPLFANINPANRASQQFFGKFGFGLVQHTYRLDQAEGAAL